LAIVNFATGAFCAVPGGIEPPGFAFRADTFCWVTVRRSARNQAIPVPLALLALQPLLVRGVKALDAFVAETRVAIGLDKRRIAIIHQGHVGTLLTGDIRENTGRGDVLRDPSVRPAFPAVALPA
jgi:hypothetical protein